MLFVSRPRRGPLSRRVLVRGGGREDLAEGRRPLAGDGGVHAFDASHAGVDAEAVEQVREARRILTFQHRKTFERQQRANISVGVAVAPAVVLVPCSRARRNAFVATPPREHRERGFSGFGAGLLRRFAASRRDCITPWAASRDPRRGLSGTLVDLRVDGRRTEGARTGRPHSCLGRAQASICSCPDW